MNAEVGPFIVRDIAPWEGAGLFRLTSNPAVMRYMGFAVHTSEAQATALIERYQNNTECRWLAVCYPDDPAGILGVAGLEVRGHQAAMTIMFRGDRKARGAGREFSVPFVQWIFTHPAIWRVWAYCHVNNVPVQRVLQRMGAEREGMLRRFEYFPNCGEPDKPQHVYVYSIVRD